MPKEALLYEKLADKKVHCKLCNHHCCIGPSQFGLCGVRQNQQGRLYTLVYGEIIAAHVDPIEKKPLYHFFPASETFSIATIGCNFQCGFCQNWQISQLSKKKESNQGRQLSAFDIVRLAREEGCASISYTYTEPTIFFEYAYDTAVEAKAAGLYNVFVSNGYMTKQTLDMIKPFLDAANIDLKSFREEFYLRNCKAHLQPVLETIAYLKKLGIWIEITTLLIPGENDSDEELRQIAAFIASLGKDIPWHISRFHPDYQFQDRKPTSLESLRSAYRFGKEAGLRYVYLGNVSQGNDTYCYHCGQRLVQRSYYVVGDNKIKDNRCSFCANPIDGIFRP